jgi:acetolactate synthase-1/2/3 large subunit
MGDVTGGELLARCLANESVKFVFGLPSPEIDPLLAQLAGHDIRLVPVRHEAAAVHMAEGLYKTTGQVAVVLGNPGPGSANLLPGVITARHEGVPVVAITSQHRLGIVYPSPPSTFQGQDQLDVFKPVVKWGGPILSWDRIPEVVRLPSARCGRVGPAPITSSSRRPFSTRRPTRAALQSSRQRPTARPSPRHRKRRSARRRRCWSRPRGRSSSPAAASTALGPTPRCSTSSRC